MEKGRRPPQEGRFTFSDLREQQDQAPEAETLRRAQKILENLGMTFDDLRGKSVLDLGTGPGSVLARAARASGIDTVIAFDLRAEMLSKHEGIRQVVGKGQELPFRDRSLDLVISHAAPPTIFKQSKNTLAAFDELERVLKEDGEARIGGPILRSLVEEDPQLKKVETNVYEFYRSQKGQWEEVARRFARLHELEVGLSTKWLIDRGYNIQLVQHEESGKREDPTSTLGYWILRRREELNKQK